MQEQPKKVNTTNAQEKMLAGAEKLHAAVASTLGPRSANVAIRRPFGAPAVVHDGVTVARACLPLADPEEDTGAEIIFGAADDTNTVGDGTTTATILCYDIASKAYTRKKAGSKTMALREGIELGTEAVLEQLNKLATPITVEDHDKLLMVATISAQTPDIGELAAEAYKQLGADGILTVEESSSTETTLELKQGMQFDRGWLSPHFVAQGNTAGEAILENPYVVILDYRIRDVNQLAPMLVRCFGAQVKLAREGKGPAPRPLLIVADQLDGEALAFLVLNHLKGGMNIAAVNAPAYGEKRQEILADIAIATGGQVLSPTTGISMDSVLGDELDDKGQVVKRGNVEHMFGTAKKVVVTKNTTLIVEGAGTKDMLAQRVVELKAQAENPDTSPYDREKLFERIAKLHSGVGVLNIGAKSDPELRERKERAIDAISAAKAALTGGILPGGGIALIRAADTADKALAEKLASADMDVRAGVQLVMEACRSPYKRLLQNAGFDPGQFLEKVNAAQAAAKPEGKQSKVPLWGVDVMDGQLVDLIKEGIIDPLLVVTAALGHASSAAVALFTSDTVITEEPTKKEAE